MVTICSLYMEHSSLYDILIIYIYLISTHIEISTWYQSKTGLDSLMGGPRKMETNIKNRVDSLSEWIDAEERRDLTTLH
jgi:hypothetical protein